MRYLVKVELGEISRSPAPESQSDHPHACPKIEKLIKCAEGVLIRTNTKGFDLIFVFRYATVGRRDSISGPKGQRVCREVLLTEVHEL